MTLSQEAEAPVNEVVLEAIGLTKHFPVRRKLRDLFNRTHDAVHAVDDVNLTLRRGRVTALVGESGSGKSTVARLLAQTVFPLRPGFLRRRSALPDRLRPAGPVCRNLLPDKRPTSTSIDFRRDRAFPRRPVPQLAQHGHRGSAALCHLVRSRQLPDCGSRDSRL